MLLKKITTILFLLPLIIIAQENSLTYEQANDINFAKLYKNNTKINSYTTKNGFNISIGDTLTIGYAKTKKNKYLFTDVFTYIIQGKATNNKDPIFLPHRYSGNKVSVKSIYVIHEKYKGYTLWENRKKRPLYVSLYVRNLKSEGGFRNVFSYSKKTIIDIEKALLTGEVVNPNIVMSQSEAIKKLKASKDLMELEIISKEEYEKIKNKLTPLIIDY